jgi:hypothetical protein
LINIIISQAITLPAKEITISAGKLALLFPSLKRATQFDVDCNFYYKCNYPTKDFILVFSS